MACALTQGYSLDACRDSIGGIKNIYLIELGNVSGVTSAAGVISAIGKANGGRFWKYNLTRATADASEDLQISEENGTLFYNQVVNIVLNKLQASTRNEIVLLAQNRLAAVVEDRNAKYWYYGKDEGLLLSGGKATTGKAFGDRNGYELAFSGQEVALALEVDSAIISGLETP